MAAPESANEIGVRGRNRGMRRRQAHCAGASAPDASHSLRVRRLARVLFLALGPLVVLTVGGFWYATSGRIVSTENAYVEAEHVLVTPAVDGMVAEVFVRDNQEVVRGQPLFQVDPVPFRLEWEKGGGRAGCDPVRDRLLPRRVPSGRSGAAKRPQGSRVPREGIPPARPARRRQCVAEGRAGPFSAASGSRRGSGSRSSRRRWGSHARESGRRSGARGRGAPSLPACASRAEGRRPSILERATVRAPAAARVSNLELQAGEYVAEGAPVFSLIAAGAPWIEANLMETQLTHIREGQSVDHRDRRLPRPPVAGPGGGGERGDRGGVSRSCRPRTRPATG